MVQVDVSEYALPRVEHRRAVRVLYMYLAVALAYFVTFAFIYSLVRHNLLIGAVHATFALAAAYLLAHLRLSGKTAVASLGIYILVAAIIVILPLDGGFAGSGTYSAFGGLIFLYYLPVRRYYVATTSTIIGLYLVVLALSRVGLVSLQFSFLNFLLFIITFGIVNGLMIFYGNEKAKVDHELNASLRQVRLLAQELEREKASVEEKVRIRTQQYRKEHAKLGASIASLSQGFLLIDPQLNIELANDMAHELLHMGANDVQGEEIADAARQASWASDLTKITTRVLHTERPAQTSVQSDDGSFFKIFATPVHNGKQVYGVAVLVQDVTEQKILDRSKDEFFSIASHELRTPLTAIRGNMSMAKDYFSKVIKGTPLVEIISDTHAASVRLIEIVNDFLDSSKLEQGKMVFNFSSVTLDPLVATVCDDLAPLIKQQGNTIVADDLKTLPAVLADEGRLRQILYNLLSNANKYSKHATVTIRGITSAGNLRIRITDTGKGIAPENQKLLFHKFQQASESILTRDDTKGTGLGLYISKLLAKNMHGDVLLETSEVGKGTTFVISLPIATRGALHALKTETDSGSALSATDN